MTWHGFYKRLPAPMAVETSGDGLLERPRTHSPVRGGALKPGKNKGAGSGGEMKVTINFLITVYDLDLTAKIPAPVADGIPVTYFSASQYTETITGSPGGYFQPGEEYKADGGTGLYLYRGQRPLYARVKNLIPARV